MQCIVAENAKRQSDSDLLTLGLSCMENHYGYLPKVFNCIFGNSNLTSALENEEYELFELLIKIYFQCKILITDKVCAYDAKDVFFNSAIQFFRLWKSFQPLKNFNEEINFIRENSRIHDDLETDSRPAHLYFLEENYEASISHIEKYQTYLTTTFANNCSVQLSNCYKLKVECYIELKNKILAKKAFKKFKRFKHDCNIGRVIVKLKNEIDDMPEITTDEPNKFVKTLMQCSSYVCENIESRIGEFKQCSKCRLKYYCSKKCQKQHWKYGHKAECKKL